jgi:hypothetical protein
VLLNTDYYVHHICFLMLFFDSAFNFAIIRSSIAMKDTAAVGLVSTLFVNGGKVVNIVLLRALNFVLRKCIIDLSVTVT